jgi:hypothetical protein
MDEFYHNCSSLLIVSILTFTKNCPPEQVITTELVSQPTSNARASIPYLLTAGCALHWIKASKNRIKGFIGSKWSSRFLGSDARLTYQFRMLRVLGLLSILLPLVLLAGSAVFDRCTIVLASVSHYYYTAMGHVFVGLLYTTGLFLFLYKGDNRAEIIATRFAGICIIVVALLPTSKDIYGCSTQAYYPSALGEELHKAFAAFFLLTMSILFCLFTRSSSRNKQGRSRNRLYRVCAGIICVIVFSIVALAKPGWLDQEDQQKLLSWATMYKPIFWLEWLALAAVGTSWLTKGQWLLADPVYQSPYSFIDNSYGSDQPELAKSNVEVAYLQGKN